MVRDAPRRAPHHEDLISLPPKKARCRCRRSDIARRPRNTGRTWWRRLLLRISKKVPGRGRAGLDRARLFRLRRRIGCRCRSLRRNGCRWRFALGLFAADFAARPGEIIGAAGGRRERLALDQRPGGERVDRGGAPAGAAEQLVGGPPGSHPPDGPIPPPAPRTAGRPTRSTGTPLDFRTPIISSIFMV